MQTTARVWVAVVVMVMAGLVGAPLVDGRPTRAQDVPGIEICTRESRLDRRTSCLQSNVEFLQQALAKNSREAQQKLAAAERDIAALQAQLAAANRDAAAVKDALAALQARLDQLGKSSPAPRSPQRAPAPTGGATPEPSR
jgi:septal ring factor EnvC (AmiA/AmiB activator)